MADKQPDWDLSGAEPGAIMPGTTKDLYRQFGEEVVQGSKGVGKGLARQGFGAMDLVEMPGNAAAAALRRVSGRPPAPEGPPSAFRQWAMSPGESVAEKTGIGVGTVAPYVLGGEVLGGEKALATGLEALAAGKAPSLVKPLSQIASRGISGGLGGLIQPADTMSERLDNAEWGALMAEGLGAVGGLGKLTDKVPAHVRERLSHGFGALIGSTLGGYLGHPYIGGGIGYATRLGDLLTEALPALMKKAGKAPSSAVGAAAAEAGGEISQPKPDFEVTAPKPGG